MAAAVEKPILIRALISPCSNDAKTVDYSGTDGYDFEKLFPRKCSSSRLDPDPDPNSGSHRAEQQQQGSRSSENAWFILESDDSGLKMTQIFVALPQDQSQLTVRRTSSTLVGSSLYEIGGYPNRSCKPHYKRSNREETYSKMRFLDIQNQSAGWNSCSRLGFEFHGNRAAAFNQYIYMFSRIRVDHAPGFHFAYVFNTIKQEGYLIQAPPEFLETPIAEFWAPLEGQGMLVSFPRGDNGNFYLHDPDQNCWEFCDDYEPLPPITLGVSSVLDGILYICDDCQVLHAYDCNKGKLLYSVKLPRLCINTHFHGEDMSFSPEHIVAVSDSSLYIIGSSLSSLFCARVSVTSNPPTAPSAKLLGVQCFRKCKIRSVLNCVPVDASLGQIAKYRMPVDASLGLVAKNHMPVNSSLHPMETDPVPMEETREEHVPSKRKSTVDDDGVRIIHVPEEMKLKRHQDMKDLGNSSLEGQD